MGRKILLLLIGMIGLSGYSQFQISGRLTDENNNPIKGCHVHVANKTSTSNSSGVFRITNLSAGKTRVFIINLGFEKFESVIDLKQDTIYNITMTREINALDEIVIKQKSNTVNTSILEQKIKLETIEKYSNQTLGEALKEVTGVSLMKTGSSIVKPIINGLHSSRVPIYNNNVRLEDQQWGTEHAPNFDINAAGKITVVKGASGLQYGGDAIGGLVIIEPISIKKDTLFGKTIMNLSSNGRGGSLSTSLHKGNFCDWSWNALATFKYLGDREAPNYVLSNTGNREMNFAGDLKYIGKKYDLSFFYSVYNARIGILSASHTGNVNDLYNSITNQIPFVIDDFTYDLKNPKQEVHHHLAKVNYNRYFNDDTTLGFQYSFQFNKRQEFDLRTGSDVNKAALDLELATHTFNLDYKSFFENLTLKSGLYTSYQNNYSSPGTGIRPLIPTYQKTDFGIYGIADYKVSETFKLESGLRYDFSTTEATKYYLKSRWDERNYSPEFDSFIVGEDGNQWLTKPKFTFNNVSASVGFTKDFTKGLNLFFNTSLAMRNPNPSEFFSDGLHHSSGVVELGNLRLEREKSFKIATTIQKKWDTFSIMVNPYVNFIQDYIFLKPFGFETTIRGAFPVWEYQQTDGRFLGVDFQTHWKMNENWEHSFSLAYVEGYDNNKKEPLIDIPPLNLNTKIQFLKKEWYDLLLELKADVVFRQNRYPDNNFTTNIIINDELSPVIVDISSTPAGYGLIHFYSEMKFKLSKKIASTVAFSVQNITNTSYRDYLNRQRYFADEMGRNFQIQLKINY
jgi:iron complex outermembrane receptor protein